MRVKCLAQEHNTMSPARARTRTTLSGVEHTNHEATAPPTILKYDKKKMLVNCFLDEDSNTTYVNEDVVEELAVKGGP